MARKVNICIRGKISNSNAKLKAFVSLVNDYKVNIYPLSPKLKICCPIKIYQKLYYCNLRVLTAILSFVFVSSLCYTSDSNLGLL
jgi:hypothetical protein